MPKKLTKKSENLNEVDLEASFKDLGKRLALLLESANLPDEVKDAWAALLPQMSLEQIGELAVLLEGNLSSNSKEVERLNQDLLKINLSFAGRRIDLKNQAIGEIEKIEEQVS